MSDIFNLTPNDLIELATSLGWQTLTEQDNHILTHQNFEGFQISFPTSNESPEWSDATNDTLTKLSDLHNLEDAQILASLNMIKNDVDLSQLSQEDRERIGEINQILEAEAIEPTVAINILINAVQISYELDHFNELDRYLIAKALGCLKGYADRGEDIIIKTTQNDVTK